MPKPGYYCFSIIDVHAKAESRNEISGRIDSKVFNYFFRQVIPGERGPRQALICFFFQRLFEACVKEGIEPVWDEENEAKVNAVLQRLNFTPMPEPKTEKKGKK